MHLTLFLNLRMQENTIYQLPLQQKQTYDKQQEGNE